MVKNVLIEKIKPGRLLVGNKMNLMVVLGESLAKFSCYYATAPEGRITDNTDFHSVKTVRFQDDRGRNTIRAKKVAACTVKDLLLLTQT